LAADGDCLLFRGNTDPSVTVTGFASSDISVWDVTDVAHPVPIHASVGIGAGAATISMTASPTGQYLAFRSAAVLAPALVPQPVNTLLSSSHGADELIVAPSALVSAAQPLADWRRAQGLQVEVVALEDVWNAFNFGMPDPLALRSFLAATRTTWQRAPRYVLLAGNGSFDYRDYLGQGGDLVPPFLVATPSGLFASDLAFADFDGDGLPEMEVGRLPVTSASELAAVVTKIIGYESAGGTWVNQALLLADADAQTDFAPDSHAATDRLTGTYTANHFELATEPVDSAHPRLLAALDAGASVMSYVGHGGADRLSALGLLTSADVPALSNGVASPVTTAFTCLINRFELPGYRPLGAGLVDFGGGGAVAVLAPSGLSRSTFGADYGRAFYRELVAGAPRLGDVVRAARGDVSGELDAASFTAVYNLLGDPALMLRSTVPVVTGPPSPSGE
jgi:hypothetical protein